MASGPITSWHYFPATWQESYDKPRQWVKKPRHHFADKGLYSQGYGLSSSHLWMWELDQKEGGAPKNGCFWIVVLEKTPESPLDCKEIKPVNLTGNQLWIFIGRTDAEAPILWPPDAKGKDPDAGKDYNQKERRVTEDEMAVTASPMQWTWTWANSERPWGTGNPGVLQSMGSWRHNFVTEQPQHRISMLKT